LKGSPTRVKKIQRIQSNRDACKVAPGDTPEEKVEWLLGTLDSKDIHIKFS